MKAKLLILSLAAVSTQVLAISDANWTQITTAYGKNDLAALNQYANNYADNTVVAYLNASANLAKKSPDTAASFISSHPNGYLYVSMIHKLLDYYYNQQEWQNYYNTYQKLPASEVSDNERCGYDLTNFALNNHLAPQSDFDYLIANKIPAWCVSLIASKLNNNTLEQKIYLKPFLYSLISNGQISQFNQLAGTFNYSPLNGLPQSSKGINSYQMVYRISSLSIKSPDQAMSELSTAQLDNFTRQYLYNQIADNLAIKQMYSLSLQAIALGNNQWLSDDEYEWRVRSYLYSSNWQQVLATINNMPEKLQNRNAWLYWKAYAAGELGQQQLASTTLQKIPTDYSYYSLLAQAELQKSLNLNYLPKASKSNELEYAQAVAQSFALYQTAKSIHSGILTQIATQTLHFVIKNSNDADIATISKKALNIGWNDMSIYAANHLANKSAQLSFPLLFTAQYRRYAQANSISPSYPMAVTRQESRFNPNALAFDGGVGLMQIMPDTANYIAKKLKTSNCFKNYECNIQFGTWFLAHLVTKFGNNPIYAAAGYNAGPGRAHHWQQVFGDKDNRIQVELIPFQITRDYVQKVLSNKLIYDNLLQPGTSSVNMLAFLQNINNQNMTYIVDDDNTGGDASGSQQN